MKTAVITGVSGAIGKAIALEYLKNGYFVIGQFNSGKEKIEKFISELKNLDLSDYFFSIKADLSNESEVVDFFNNVNKSFKHIDVLVNNAGVDLYKLVTDTTEKEWDYVFNVNVKAPFMLTKLFSKEMVKRESGKIIFISSIWGNNGASMESCYSASKGALISFSKSIAKELAPSKINVNCVCPGVIKSPMNDRFNGEEKQELINSTPLGRFGLPSEIAELVYFLTSEKAEFITGQVITADGGFTL